MQNVGSDITTKYRMLEDSKTQLHVKKGTLVYPYQGYDYGLANDDTKYFKKRHFSATLDPKGKAQPFFTVPFDDVESVE